MRLALQVISGEQTITAIAKELDCSCTTVHEEKNRTLTAAMEKLVKGGSIRRISKAGTSYHYM